MQNRPFDINNLRVASPCSVGWETMTGDDRVRHCYSCQLNIYNTASMTMSEVEELIFSREGRLCIRMHRRSDGTVITKDCPVGLRNHKKRLFRSIGTAISLILGITSSGFSQKAEFPKSKLVVIENSSSPSDQTAKARLKGVIKDQNGAVIHGASVVLYRGKPKSGLSRRSDDSGSYYFSDVSPQTYTLEVSFSGFSRFRVKNLKLDPGTLSELNVVLAVEGNVTVGIFAGDSPIDTTTSTVQTTITARKISLIPHE